MASDFTLSILGCGSAVPTPLHNPSCQILSRRGSLFMIDCGEGAQAMMRRMKIPFSRLRHIFISHLHGDHLLGLPGLLSTLALNDVQGTVTVHIFERGANMLRNVLNVISHDIPFNLEWNILDPDGGQLLVDAAGLTVSSFPLYHRVPCVGFRFTEQPKPRHLRGDMANFLGIPPYRREAIRLGADFVRPDGTVVPNEELTTPPDPSLSYAYCSDTMADSRIVPAIEGVTTLPRSHLWFGISVESPRARPLDSYRGRRNRPPRRSAQPHHRPLLEALHRPHSPHSRSPRSLRWPCHRRRRGSDPRPGHRPPPLILFSYNIYKY